MEPPAAKPRHLAADYAAQFGDAEIAAAYRHRPPYPPETFTHVARRLGPPPRCVVELGAGTGDFTLGLAPHVDRLIAVEPSAPMREAGRCRDGLPGTVEWVAVAAEDFAFDGRYAAVIAAEAFHWLDWSSVLPRIAASLSEQGSLILVERRLAGPLPWGPELLALVQEYSTNRDYVAYDIVEELQSRGLIAVTGRAETGVVSFEQSVTDYVESFHSRNGFSRARLLPDRARNFDGELASLLARHCPDGAVRLPVQARIAWARPLAT